MAVKYYLIKECTLKDLARVIRIKTNSGAKYNPKEFGNYIQDIDTTIIGDEYLPFPTVPEGTQPAIFSDAKTPIYLWNCDAEDPQCTDITGGWDFSQTLGWGTASNYGTCLKDEATKGLHIYSYQNTNTNVLNNWSKSVMTKNKLPINDWKKQGYTSIIIELQDYYTAKGINNSDAAAASQTAYRNIYMFLVDEYKSRTTILNNAYNNYCEKLLISKCRPKRDSELRQKIMPNVLSCTLQTNNDLLDYLVVTLQTTLNITTMGPKILIKKIYVI